MVRDSQNASDSQPCYAFGDFLLDPEEGVLTRKGEPISLTPKTFQTLRVLVEKRGHVVRKEELLQAVWPDTFVEEGNLKFNISVLRKAIGDGGTFIETVPRRGYRFAAPVRQVSKTEEPVAPASDRRRAARAFFVLAMLAALAGGAASILYRAHRYRQAPTARRVRPSIAVLDFKNLSERSDQEWISRALSEEIATELAGGGKLRIVSEEDVSRMKRELSLPDADSFAKDTLSRVHKDLASDYVVLGSYAELGTATGKIRLDLRVQNTGSGETIALISETGELSDLFQIVNQVGARLRSSLGVEALTAEGSERVRAAIPGNPEAARLYAEGLAKLRVFDGTEATDLLEKAAAADPHFPMAHSALAEAWSVQGYDERARSEAKKAFDLSGRLSREYQLLVEAQYREATADWGRAIELYRTLYDFFPDNLDYGLKLASVEALARRGADSVQTISLLKASTRPPADEARIELAGAAAEESLGDFKEVLSTADRAAAEASGSGAGLLLARALFYRGWAEQELGYPQPAMEAQTEARQLYQAAGDRYWEARTLLSMADIFRMQDDLDDASEKESAAFAIDQITQNKAGMAWDLNERGIVYLRKGDFQQSKELHQQSLNLFREINDQRGISVALNNTANVLDEQGDLVGAKSMYEQALDIAHQVKNDRDVALTMTNIGEELFALGDLSAAEDQQQQALVIAKRLGDKSIEAYALFALGQIYAAEAKPMDARASYEESLRLRNELQEKGNAAETLVAMAESLDEPSQTTALINSLRRDLQEFQQENLIDDEIIAGSTLAAVWLKTGQPVEAQRALDGVAPLLSKSTSRVAQFEFAIVSARTKAVSGRTAEARRALEATLSKALKLKYARFGFETRLMLAELNMPSNRTAARSQLQSLQLEARRRHFLKIAERAAADLRLRKPLS